ncbi:type I secretion system permease/ATPase [Vibrio mimicus]|uniref:Hemolysin secretion/processing ATP-binding protein n=1 Tax=Vibrio mimicus VM603 TaxID=671074 RepID=D2YCN1_VIBMI|nr:type I secretion system permease/ATPase [Vibrio mimicus]EEW07482.1 Hemolysin secretion/processing ATP-binding protein [Vibrio mimicus VM603]
MIYCSPLKTTLYSVCELANHFGVLTDVTYLEHRLGRSDGKIDEIDLLRVTRWSGLKATVIKMDFRKIQTLPLPLMIATNQGWKVVVKFDNKWVTVQNQGSTESIEFNTLHDIYTGQILLATNSTKYFKRHPFGFRWFIPSIIKHKKQLIWIVVVSLALQFISLITPLLFQNVIDKVLVSRSITNLHVFGVAILALAIMEPIYGLLRSWLFSNLTNKVGSELSSKLYGHLIALPISYFVQRQTGQILARVKELDGIRQFITGSTLTLILDLVFVGLFVGVMLLYSTTLTAIVTVSLIGYFVFWSLVGIGLRERVNRAFEANADTIAMLTESIIGIETIKAMATESYIEKQWQDILAKFNRLSFAATNYGNWASQGIGLIQKLSAALLLWFGVKMVLDGKLSLGELVAFNMYAGHITQPILRLAQVWQDFQHTLISLQRLGDIFNESAEIGNGSLTFMPVVEGSIRFEDVRFRYQEQSPEVLCGLNFTILPGEFVGITGPSGSGKSTLTKLLQRLYTPTEGVVLIDGLDLAIVDPVHLRRHISIVPQESQLFSGTVAENICLNCPKATGEDMVMAARLAGVFDFIDDLPNGLDSAVGEKGALLSGGQRQRIALARALISNPKILILDEATSALDYESEASIMSRMQEICKNRTVISIAHRLKTIQGADKIIVIDKGNIAECGNHKTLMKNSSIYAKIWDLQVGSS